MGKKFRIVAKELVHEGFNSVKEIHKEDVQKLSFAWLSDYPDMLGEVAIRLFDEDKTEKSLFDVLSNQCTLSHFGNSIIERFCEIISDMFTDDYYDIVDEIESERALACPVERRKRELDILSKI